MNKFLQNLNKIEFIITYACTGSCKHCSEGNHSICGEQINKKVATNAIIEIAKRYKIQTVMAFGGEPLLYPDIVYSIMDTAYKMDIPKRQIITNGYFSKDPEQIHSVANNLAKCHVNDLLLSVDAFHQETIPLKAVKEFATKAKSFEIPIRLQPAWLISKNHDNPYNNKTRKIIDSFKDIEVYENDGNIIFPEGNAKIYLSEYFTDDLPKNPYIEKPDDIRCISFSPNGDVLGSNIYSNDICDILDNYKP